MFCSYCGQPLADDMAFCVRCGRPVEMPEEEELPLEFEDSPETTGPLPRLDEEGGAVVEEDGAESHAASDDSTGEEPDAAAASAGDGAEGGEPSSGGPSQAQKLAALVKPAGPRPLAAEAPVVRVHKSRAPMIIGFVLVAVVVGCACFVGGLYAATEGLLGPAEEEGARVPASQPAATAAVEATSGTESTDGSEAPAADEAAASEDANGGATADEVAQAVQEGWEMLVANEFSEDAQRQWTQTVLSLQPEGMLEALAALVGVEGDSLLPLYLYDAAPLQSQLSIDEFLNGQQAVVTTSQEPTTKTDLAELTVYFGDLGQTVAGQVPKVNLPLDVDEASRLDMKVAPMGEETGEEGASEVLLTVNDGADSYVVYRYEDRWYLFAPLLQKADV